MATIMASAPRVAGLGTRLRSWCLGLTVLPWMGAGAADVAAVTPATPATVGSLPAGYTLSYDKDRWSEAFSVFHMAVAEPFGSIGTNFAASDDPRLRPLTRLDSFWTGSLPLLPAPLRVGDAVSSTGFWNDPARLGGLQLGTLQPAAPEVTAPPGVNTSPFAATGASGLGAGSTQFIDHLRTMVQFQTQSLVAPGHSLYSLESGRLRENFEVRSNDYGPWITSGTYRYGVNAATTLDGQAAQVGGQQSFLGVGVLERLGSLGLLSARLGGSHELDATGWVARMGYDFSHERLSIAVRSHIQSAGFLNVGDSSVSEALRQRTLASARMNFGALGRISLASATQTYVDDTRRDLVALSHAMPFGSGGVVSTAAAYSPGPAGSTAVLLSFTYPFDYLGPATARTVGAVNSALDRSIVDAFGQTRLPPGGNGALRPWGSGADLAAGR